ncbi:MAG: hypothetical protein ABSC25_11335 [Roseiarcus sp.]
MSWKEELAAKSERFEKRFAEKMPQTDDLTLIVLKGHLLIEEWINSTIDELLPNPQALKAAQLDCFQRTRLLMAMLPDHGFHDILELFEKLNTIRNKVGHMLEPPQIDDRIAAFIDSVESRMETQLKASELPQPKRLSRAISFLTGQLHILGLFYIGVSKLMSLNGDYGEASK